MEYLDRTYLIMLMKYGITTAIVNAYDKESPYLRHGCHSQLPTGAGASAHPGLS
jgi:hypothetical protein